MTRHEIYYKSSLQMNEIATESVSLVVTSPPYPMIEMWMEDFSIQDEKIKHAINEGNCQAAFEMMHELLNKVWAEVDRVLIPGGIVCINIGDATKTINQVFQLFSNHSKIINQFIKMGYCVLPDIIWRKQTNAPNKFMGSGMYPPGAYVTYEHEYILIFRKGSKRMFEKEVQKQNRRESAYFWEERNIWFSDMWDIKGVGQRMADSESRKRSGAYPFELAYRLINMFSVKGDTILDPFLGIGTTSAAAIASKRNSIGYEINAELQKTIQTYLKSLTSPINSYIKERVQKHEKFITEQVSQNKNLYSAKHHAFLVKTRQEIDIKFDAIQSIDLIKLSINSIGDQIQATYALFPLDSTQQGLPLAKFQDKLSLF